MILYFLGFFSGGSQSNKSPKARIKNDGEETAPSLTYTSPLWSQASKEGHLPGTTPGRVDPSIFCIEYESDDSDDNNAENTGIFVGNFHEVPLEVETPPPQKKSLLARWCDAITPKSKPYD